MHYIEQLERSAETACERRNDRVLGFIDAHANSGTTTDSLPRKDVPVSERLRQITVHCFDLDGHRFPFRSVSAGVLTRVSRGLRSGSNARNARECIP